MAKRSGRPAGQSLLRFCFVAYCFLMLWLLFGQRWGTEIYTQALAERINLKPFATIGRYWELLHKTQNQTLLRHAVINLAGNVVMFIPLGVFLPGIWRRFRSFFQTFFLSILLILTVELVQYATNLGTCDIDDLILNMTGIFVGYLFYKIKHR